MKPKILLAANKNKEYYVEAVNSCGGIADAQYCPKFSADYDALILCGGNDINPERYGEKTDGAVEIDFLRDEAEFELFKAFVEAKKPIMGICRGFQLINVALGGSLYQDLADANIHTNKTDYYITHEVEAAEGSIYEKFYGKNFPINSSHHQGVKKLACGLKTTLMYKGIIEGFEHESLPIFGVQFHPERMCFSQKRADTVNGAKIFEYFIGKVKSL